MCAGSFFHFRFSLPQFTFYSFCYMFFFLHSQLPIIYSQFSFLYSSHVYKNEYRILKMFIVSLKYAPRGEKREKRKTNFLDILLRSAPWIDKRSYEKNLRVARVLSSNLNVYRNVSEAVCAKKLFCFSHCLSQ